MGAFSFTYMSDISTLVLNVANYIEVNNPGPPDGGNDSTLNCIKLAAHIIHDAIEWHEASSVKDWREKHQMTLNTIKANAQQLEAENEHLKTKNKDLESKVELIRNEIHRLKAFTREELHLLEIQRLKNEIRALNEQGQPSWEILHTYVIQSHPHNIGVITDINTKEEFKKFADEWSCTTDSSTIGEFLRSKGFYAIDALSEMPVPIVEL